MAAPRVTGVELGFVEEKTDDKWKLLSHFFPSKVGGMPAWLALKNIPLSDDVKCENCQKPCVFLLQVYAPLNDKENCFHRTLFLFICKDPKCNEPNRNRNLVVLRCQLPRINEFYSAESPESAPFSWDSAYPKAEEHQPLCCACGCAGPKKCARCQNVNYCGREHQTIDWKSGHKHSCGKAESNDNSDEKPNRLLFPEYELVTEPELMPEKEVEKSEKLKMDEYKEFMKSSGTGGAGLADTKEIQESLDNMAVGEDTTDEQFMKFKKKIAPEPEQVLRYERKGQPLWITGTGQPKAEDIQPCTCGSSRVFEFQVMPQLLNDLDVDSTGDSLDWGIIAIYSCESSCGSAGCYKREFAWKQDITDDSNRAK